MRVIPVRLMAAGFFCYVVILAELTTVMAEGIPEPGIMLYGKVWENGSVRTTGGLTWSYVATNPGETVVSSATLGAIDDGFGNVYSYAFYLPAESSIAGEPATPNTFHYTGSGVLYEREALVDGFATDMATTQVLISYDNRGLIERVDLAVAGSIPDPQLQVTPTVASVSSSGGQAAFEVINAGGGNLYWTAQVVEGASWLTIQSGLSGRDNGTVVVACDENTYLARTGRIVIASMEPDAGSIEVVVRQEPSIHLPSVACQRTSISVAADEGNGVSTAPLAVWNGSGSGTLDYTLLTTATWRSCVPTTGSSTIETTTHTAMIDLTGLTAGDHAATIAIVAAGANNSPLEVPVRVTAADVPPTVTISSVAPNMAQPPLDVVTFDGTAEDAAGAITAYLWESDVDGSLGTSESFSLSSYELTVGNHALVFTGWDDEGTSASDHAALSVSDAPPTAGIVSLVPNPVAAGETVALSLAGQDNDEAGQSIVEGELTWPTRVYTGVLPGSHQRTAPAAEGIYTIEYRAQDDERTWSETSSITLQVIQAAIGSDPTSLTIECVEGASTLTQRIEVWNTTSYGDLVYVIDTTPTWLTCHPTTGTSSGEVTTHTVAVDPAGLGPGDYAGTLTIGAVGASNSPLSLPVDLRVTERPFFTLETAVDPPEGGTVIPAGRTRHAAGSEVRLSATPNPGWTFEQWSGDVTGATNPIMMVMDTSKTVTARFAQLPGPNLTGDLTAVEPHSVVWGTSVTLEGHVANRGNEDTTEPIGIEFLAVDPVTRWRGAFCDSILLDGGLAAGESIDLASLQPGVCRDGIPFGRYRIEMNIDPANAVAESCETDNKFAWAPVVILPDRPNLRIVNFDFSPQDVSTTGGDSIDFSGEIMNSGTQSTSGSFWVEFRLWPNWDFRPTGPYLCDSLLVGEALEPGESIDLTTIAPRNTYALPEGAYYVGVVIDPLDTIQEQREDDNVRWQVKKKLYVGPRPTRANRWLRYE